MSNLGMWRRTTWRLASVVVVGALAASGGTAAGQARPADLPPGVPVAGPFRAPVPSPAEVRAAQAALQKRFPRDAAERAGGLRMAAVYTQHAETASSPPAERYVALREALAIQVKLRAEAKVVGLMDGLGTAFAIDGPTERRETYGALLEGLPVQVPVKSTPDRKVGPPVPRSRRLCTLLLADVATLRASNRLADAAKTLQ
ncbi:MAG TPA: hypothetical protein VF796_26115, partial [Humisphaera sp.]